ncbi:MAG: glycosyltransferase family 4 protein [Psychroflexus salarius]
MKSKDDILIITSYYPPETGAASNRIFALSEQLKHHKYKVKVISPLPNYPYGKVLEAYRNKFKVNEVFKQIPVTRLFIFASKSNNKFIRLFSILSYAISLFFYLLVTKTPQKQIIQCSPLFVGFFAVLAGRLRGKTLILNVSDLWPLAGLEMGILSKGLYYRILEYIEGFIYKHSDRIIGQSEEILTHIKKNIKTSTKPLFLYRNFPQFNLPKSSVEVPQDEIKFVYAGLIGIAQGIEEICKQVNFPENSSFHIYGDGPKADEVKALAKDNKRIFYHGSLSRNELHKTLMPYDVTIIPLKNRIYGSVPSKIFEYSKLGLPILFFSDGEGADVVEQLGLGIAQREVNYKSLERNIEQIVQQEINLPTKAEVLAISKQAFNLETQFKAFEQSCLNYTKSPIK